MRGIPAVSPWRDQVAQAGLKNARRHIRDLGLKVSGLCRRGMFPAADKTGFEANLEDNARALEEAVELAADCLVLVVGGMPEGSKDLAGSWRQVEDAIAWLKERARPPGLKIAIEPLHPMYCSDRSVVSTMAQALDICDAVGGNAGVACDVYHVWWDPGLEAQIKRAGKSRLHAFHLCDLQRAIKDRLLDRSMMGDVVINIRAIRSLAEAQGYAGFHEVEIFSNDNWWKRDIDDVLSKCIQRHRDRC
jgi:sugar phosphate isomerase/epimerase